MRSRTRCHALAAAAAALGLVAAPAGAGTTVCEKTASLARKACQLETRSDGILEAAKCLGSEDPDAVAECSEEAAEEAAEARAECSEQRDARLEVCESLGEDVYDPMLDPADFVAGIDNPYTPFEVGRRWVYEKTTAEGTERIEVEVLADTRTILGIEATVVRDVVFLDGERVEDTLDWVAQQGNRDVWYLGEIAQNFEDGSLVDLEGSWEAGVNGAKPGYWMRGNPMVGEVYRQEFLLGEAEDIGQVLSLDAMVMVPAGSFAGCLQTLDYTPLEPDGFEHKFYAPGVGLVLEVDLESGERTELIEFTTP